MRTSATSWGRFAIVPFGIEPSGGGGVLKSGVGGLNIGVGGDGSFVDIIALDGVEDTFADVEASMQRDDEEEIVCWGVAQETHEKNLLFSRIWSFFSRFLFMH